MTTIVCECCLHGKRAALGNAVACKHSNVMVICSITMTTQGSPAFSVSLPTSSVYITLLPFAPLSIAAHPQRLSLLSWTTLLSCLERQRLPAAFPKTLIYAGG